MQTWRFKERGFTLIETLSQLVVLMVLATMLPLFVMITGEWRWMKDYREEVEWEYAMNELIQLINTYDYSKPSLYDSEIYFFEEETIRNNSGNLFAKADLTLRFSSSALYISKNDGYELLCLMKTKFYYEVKDDGFVLKHINENDEIKERRFYVKWIN